jgi:thiol-disulfide isomerase/thioredoxin
MPVDEPSAVERRSITPARLALGALGVALLIAAGVGVYFSLPPADPPPAGTERVAGAFPLRLHPRPQTLPNIAFEDNKGRRLTLADFRGKIVLLNIWATWCPPCRREMPSLDRLQAKLGGADFEVVTVSIDQGDDALFLVEEFFSEIGVKHLRIYLDRTGSAARQLDALGLPVTILVDRGGMELGRLVGPAEWDSHEALATLRRYLDTPVKS